MVICQNSVRPCRVNMHLGNFDQARENYMVAMNYMQELGANRNVQIIKSDLAHILRYEGNYSQALSAYHETIREWQRFWHRAAIAHQLESTAFIYKALEHTDKATRLLGAAETLREKIKIDMNMQERKEYDKEFASLWGEGRSMTMDEAIELALEESGLESN